MSFVKTALILVLLGAARSGWTQAADASAPAPVVWKLVSDAQVDRSGVFLDQIVTGAQPLPHVCLTHAPRVGQTNSFTRADVMTLVQHANPSLVLTNWTGPAEAHVSRRVRVLEDGDLVDLLTAALQKDYVKNQGELELHITRAGPRPEVPDEPLTLTVTELPANGVSPDFIVSFELWDARERVGGWQVPVKAAVWRDVPVAQSTLQRGEPLKGADIAMQRADILVQRDIFFNYPTTDDTLELTEDVPAGRPILSRCVRTRPLILRGEMVEGVFQDGTLGISLVVESLEDGVLGQTVRVRNPITRRELHGKVENEKTIRINL